MNTSVAVRAAALPFGNLLREWRQRRHLSQLDLSADAEISSRHLSFLETGRARPSRDMVPHLAEHLRVPLRERNLLLQSAGFAPHYPAHDLDGPDMAAARRTLDILLHAHEPFPALAVDRHWQLVRANNAILPLLAGGADWLKQPPLNVIRYSLHPEGLAPQIVNYVEWRQHILHRLDRQVELTADRVIAALADEVRSYPVSDAARNAPGTNRGLDRAIAIPIQIRLGDQVMSYLSTTTIFGTPLDVTLAELAVETFFPADEATARAISG